ncbi:MAG: uncharacterized protein QOH46_1759 [Solirubrobacteraceae bacterium]|nr:uncharacterized protein [Solirubrobacteraceae bacterium]
MRLEASNLPALARGCAVLGAGGGGDPSLALVMATLAVEEHGPVRVLAPDELSADTLVMACGFMGAPAVADERIWSGDEGRTLRAAVEAHRGGPVGALMPFQVGGAGGVLPVTWAARMGLALVDADGMGRAFPGIHQQAMHVAGIGASPVVLADGRGDTVVVQAAEDARAERLARSAVGRLGGVCAAALYCMTAADLPTAAIERSLTLAVEVGEAMAAGGPAERVQAVVGVLGGAVLAEGRVVELEPRVTGGFAGGSATIHAGGGAPRLRLELQSEFLLALEDGAVRAAVPDLICVLASETGEPVATGALRLGRRVTVIAAPGPDVWRSPAGLALAGPRAFGYDVDHAPAGQAADGAA